MQDPHRESNASVGTHRGANHAFNREERHLCVVGNLTVLLAAAIRAGQIFGNPIGATLGKDSLAAPEFDRSPKRIANRSPEQAPANPGAILQIIDVLQVAYLRILADKICIRLHGTTDKVISRHDAGSILTCAERMFHVKHWLSSASAHPVSAQFDELLP
jgi:hypothetical protein